MVHFKCGITYNFWVFAFTSRRRHTRPLARQTDQDFDCPTRKAPSYPDSFDSNQSAYQFLLLSVATLWLHCKDTLTTGSLRIRECVGFQAALSACRLVPISFGVWLRILFVALSEESEGKKGKGCGFFFGLGRKRERERERVKEKKRD